MALGGLILRPRRPRPLRVRQRRMVRVIPFDAFIVAKTQPVRWGKPKDFKAPAVFLASGCFETSVNATSSIVDGGNLSLTLAKQPGNDLMKKANLCNPSSLAFWRFPLLSGLRSHSSGGYLLCPHDGKGFGDYVYADDYQSRQRPPIAFSECQRDFIPPAFGLVSILKKNPIRRLILYQWMMP